MPLFTQSALLARSAAAPVTDASSFGPDARELLSLYNGEKQKHENFGLPDDEAHRRAIRACQHEGWFKTKDGWKRVAPNVRDKVNVTEGIQQPDGTYFIEGVGVFHPNAIKGKQLAFSADDIRRYRNNTNRSIASGSPPPALVIGHPSEEQQTQGIQLDSHGDAINWREWPGKPPGWSLCDLVNVKPEAFHRMQTRKLPSLSVGFAKDCHGLNRRFGHLALLGGTSQALSHLPATEVFSAVSGNYLCFSADQELFPKGKTMKMSEKQKSCFAALYSACEGAAAAHKSAELGEPDADNKLAEAYSAATRHAKEFFDAGEMEEAPEGQTPAPEATPEAGAVPQAAAEPEQAPASFSAESLKEQFSSPDGDPAAAFNAVCDHLAKVVKVNEALRVKDRANANRQRWQNFQAETVALRKSGRHLPGEDILKEQFTACFDSKDVDKALALTLKGYKSMPAMQTAATFNRGEPVFDSRDAAARALVAKKPTLGEMAGTKPTLTAEDLMFAALGDSFSAE